MFRARRASPPALRLLFFESRVRAAPGTFAYVYAGRIGKALTDGGATSKPWYVYACGMAFVAGLIKIAGDVASGVINAMQDDEPES